ncbi:cytochrome P450 [Mycobacterium sp. SA01]|uniref:cytochrome P450 n=1 Tax=Mycobacterium sp. SA01 TaxID=3238820 RepID=UPI00351AB91A
MSAHTIDLPERLVTDFDIYDPSLGGEVDRLNEKVRELADAGPIVYSTAHGGHWIITGYQEAHAVLRDAETFSSYPNNLVGAGDGKFIPIELDPPEHTSYRKVLQPLFSPRRMKEMEAEIRLVVDRLIDNFADRGSAEFVSEFAHELPTSVFLTLMGWPLEDAPLFTGATDIAILGKPGATEEENLAARHQAAGQMFGYFAQVVADRRARPDATDITSVIINTPLDTPEGPRQLTDDELCRMFFLLLIAGLHTVQGTLAWSVIHLAGRPALRQQLIEDPGLLPGAVEEMLRYEAAVSMGRNATVDTEIGGLPIKQGDQLVVILAGVNRDRGEFVDPDEVQLDRTPNRHLAFGSGPHRCIGSHLARIEVAAALEAIHRRIPDYRIDTSKPVLSHASQVRGVTQLPILFTPENRSARPITLAT